MFLALWLRLKQYLLKFYWFLNFMSEILCFVDLICLSDSVVFFPFDNRVNTGQH